MKLGLDFNLENGFSVNMFFDFRVFSVVSRVLYLFYGFVGVEGYLFRCIEILGLRIV